MSHRLFSFFKSLELSFSFKLDTHSRSTCISSDVFITLLTNRRCWKGHGPFKCSVERGFFFSLEFCVSLMHQEVLHAWTKQEQQCVVMIGSIHRVIRSYRAWVWNITTSIFSTEVITYISPLRPGSDKAPGWVLEGRRNSRPVLLSILRHWRYIYNDLRTCPRYVMIISTGGMFIKV